MEEFLNVLKIRLMDWLMPDEVDAQIALYKDYIHKEIADGRTPEQVLKKLGDPAKVADMIVAHKRGEDAEGSEDAEVVDGTCAGCGGGCFRDSGGAVFDCGKKNLQTAEDVDAEAQGSVVGGTESCTSGQGFSDTGRRGTVAGGTKSIPSERKKASSMSAQEINAQIQNPEHGFHAEFKENEGWDIRFGKLKLNTWYGTFIILGVVLGVFILLSELTH